MDTIIKLLEVILTWPVSVLIICLTFFVKFKDAISTFLKNIKSIRTPGGAEVQMQTTSTESKPQEGRYITPDEETVIRNLLAQGQLTQQQKQQLEQEVAKAYNFAKHWKFTYLNAFFVPLTKQVLRWAADIKKFDKQFYHIIWALTIPDESQRNIILDVLSYNYMLETSDGINYEITPHGYDFLEFIGYIPARPKVN
jgi:hypothetical protein